LGSTELLAAEELVIGVLHPALAQRLVGQIVGVFEDGQPRHQSRRQRRLTGAIRIGLPERLLQEPPVHLLRQHHQRMAHVDDRIQPRAQKIALSAVAPLSRPHRIPRQITSAPRESQIQFARNSLVTSHFPANPIVPAWQFSIQIQRLRISSRTTISTIRSSRSQNEETTGGERFASH
jgi:hypothetical protein